MRSRQVLDRTTTPDGKALELALEHGFHILRVDGVPLMSSGMRGSEEAMASVASAELGPRRAPRILIGGLGMGYTLRAVLDTFGDSASVCVAELMPAIIEYNRGVLGALADHPLGDPRVELYRGDVRRCFERRAWDAILMDVDNGPSALTVRSNRSLYGPRGLSRMTDALAPGGVLIVWSAFQSPGFLEELRRTGLSPSALPIRARWPERKGPMHTLFVALRPR